MPAAPLRLTVREHLTPGGWHTLRRRVLRGGGAPGVVLDLSGVERLDAPGTARLLQLVADGRAAGVPVGIAHAGDEVRRRLGELPPTILEPPEAPPRRSVLEWLGTLGLEAGATVRDVLLLIRDVLPGLLPFGAQGIKWDLTVAQMAAVGARATGIVVFISFLVGIVLALNGALQLRQFGAQIYIANLVAVSMTREMGPLMTAVIVAGRSGSAIAAELGAMVVSEEVDALRTMGLRPARFLVVPKLVALCLTMPLLSVLAISAGILGGYAIGTLTLGLPHDAYLSQTVKSLFTEDVLAGLLKSVAFGAIIGLVGAYKGLNVRGGPEGVGRATTAAVVTAIVLCIIANACFTTIFYLVG